MATHESKGWSGILGELHEPPAEERTDPHLEFEPLSFPDSTSVDNDPVLTAMTELDGPQTLLSPRPEAAARPPLVPARPSLPRPAAPEPNPTPRQGLQATPRAASGAKLTLPSPVGPPTGPTRATPLAGPGDAAPSFSSASLMDKLDAAPAAPRAPRPGSPAPTSSAWREYRELILSVVGGAALLIGVLIYQRMGAVEPVVIQDPAPPVPVAPPPAPVLPPETPPTPPVTALERPAEVAPSPVRAAIPMLTLLSMPSGATVEINGADQGKTPLIVPAPRDLEQLSVILTMDGYKKWVGEVRPNEAGHYSASVKLEPKR